MRELTDKAPVSIEVERESADATSDAKPQAGLIEAIVENIPHMIFVKRAEDLRFVLFNKAGEELIGYSRNDMIGKSDYDFFPKEEADFFTQKDRAVLSGKTLVDVPEEPIETKNLGRRVLHTKKIPIFDADGEPAFLVGISEDITEHREREEKVRRSEARQRALVSAIPDMIFRLDTDGKILDFKASEQAPVLTEKIIGGNLADIFSRSFVAEAIETIRRTAKEKTTTEWQYAMRTPDGIANYEARLVASGPKEVVAIVRDVTRMRQAEELRRAFFQRVLEAQEEERRRIALELHDETGQCLTSISVRLATLAKLDSVEEIQKHIKEIREITNHTTKEVSRLARGLHLTAIDDLGFETAISRLVTDCGRQHGIKTDFEMSGLKHASDIDRSIATTVYRIVQEALTNVVKHASASWVSVVCTRKGDSLRLVIEDDGIGFDPPADCKEIEGLGLYGMHERASLVGGIFTMESSPGSGTMLIADLPISPKWEQPKPY